MMSSKRKRELRLLIRAKVDPVVYARNGFKRRSLSLGPVEGVWFMTIQIAAFIALAVAGSLFGILGIVFTLPFLFGGMIAAIMLSPKSEQQRLQELCPEHDYKLCVWCTHPVDGLPDRSPCPECGVRFDHRASATINRSNYDSLQPAPEINRRRRKYAFARALRERDRV